MKLSAFFVGTVLWVAATLGLSACASSSSSHFDQAFGQALRSIRAQQTLNPHGADPAAMASGMDAAAAIRAQLNYLQSFTTPAKPATGDAGR